MSEIKKILMNNHYLISLGISEDIAIDEIRKGKVNHIYKITDRDKRISTIVKKSDDKLAGMNSPILSKYPISKMRNYIEANVLKYIADNISDNYVPHVLAIDKEHSMFIMEYLDGYEDVRDMFLNFRIPPSFATTLSSMLADIYIKTADVPEEIIGCEIRSMLDVNLLLLTKIPYDISWVSANQKLVDIDFFIKILANNELFPYVNELANTLKGSKQALLNGDLHLGSICYKDSIYKIYDYEFAFKGPVAYEIGKVIAHMVLAYFYVTSLNKKEISESLLEQISIFYDEIIKKLKNNIAFSNISLKSDIIRFCGLELISRITGILQLKYITEIPDSMVRDNLQKTIFNLGREMIKVKASTVSGKQLIEYVSKSKNQNNI